MTEGEAVAKVNALGLAERYAMAQSAVEMLPMTAGRSETAAVVDRVFPAGALRWRPEQLFFREPLGDFNSVDGVGRRMSLVFGAFGCGHAFARVGVWEPGGMVGVVVILIGMVTGVVVVEWMLSRLRSWWRNAEHGDAEIRKALVLALERHRLQRDVRRMGERLVRGGGL